MIKTHRVVSNSPKAQRPAVYTISIDDVQRQARSVSKKGRRIFYITFIVIIIVVILALIGILVWRFGFKPHSFTNKCASKCSEPNTLCFSRSESNTSFECACKPGYVQSSGSCQQYFCSNQYQPYTRLEDSIEYYKENGLPYSDRFLRPYCCPSKQLSNECCGVARQDLMTSLSQEKQRIIGGQSLNENTAFPWVVFISQVYKFGPPNAPTQLVKRCTGSLISERVVITAGHCVEIDPNDTPFNSEFPNVESMIRVKYGTSRLNETGNERRALKIIQHPAYDGFTLQNDLALIILDKSVERSDNVDFICLYNQSKNDDQTLGRRVFTAGWGSIVPLASSLLYPDVMHYVDLMVQPMSRCEYILPGMSYLFNPETHVCAGYDASTGKDTCYGDSGGPLMILIDNQWFLYGIASFGSQPDCALGPSMFSRASFYSNWVSSQIR